MDLPINQIICGDCLEVMKDWPDNCVDLVLTDPPFNVGLIYDENTNDDRSDYLLWIKERYKQLYRLLCEDTRLYTFTTDDKLFSMRPLLENIGFVYAQTLIWYGPNLVGGTKRVTGDWHYMYEPCLLMRKGKRTPMLSSELTNCYNVQVHTRPQSNHNAGRFHVAQKPTPLMISLISRTPGNIILDPFCGSGTTCVAAKMLGRRYIGIDISEKYCEVARQRLKAVDTGVPVKEQQQGQGALFG